MVIPLCMILLLLTACERSETLPEISLLRLPGEGIQPMVQVDSSQTVHLLYFSGDPSGGDLFYSRRKLADDVFTDPIRVNSQQGSAIAIGTVRGARMDLDEEGRVHVAWMGSSTAEPRGPDGAIPMLYTRLDTSGGRFQEQRNVITEATGLDGGGTVAAGPDGAVYVIWHADPEKLGEDHRRVWAAKSLDGGETFSRERPLSTKETGVCGCCGLEAEVSSSGKLQVLYRGAKDVRHRDMFLLTGSTRPMNEKGFTARLLEKWEIGACPMSTSSITSYPEKTLMAWETDGRISWAEMNEREEWSQSAVRHAPGTGENRKHPAIAASGVNGTTLLAWTEGTGWQKGGALHWQLYEADGTLSQQAGQEDGVPIWGRPAIVAQNGNYTILY